MSHNFTFLPIPFPPSKSLSRYFESPNLYKPTCTLPPPATVPQTITLAINSLDTYLSTGAKLAQISAIVPGLNPLIEDAVPYSDGLLNTFSHSLIKQSKILSEFPSVSLLFKSAGTAAAAQAQLRRKIVEENEPDNVRFASYFRRDSGKERISMFANVIVNPTSARGDRVMDDLEAVFKEAPDAIWVLVNPDFGIDRAAVGMREMGRRDAFLNQFKQFEIRRPQLIPVERGALMQVYGSFWTVFALVKEGYVIAGEFEGKPGADRITTCVRKVISAANLEKTKDGSEWDAEFDEFLKVIAVFAALVGAVYFSLYIAART